MYKAQDYTYRVFWSEEDGEYVGTVTEIPSLSFLDTDQSAAFSGIVQAVGDVLKLYEEDGETAPIPFSKRNFSGKFSLRMTKAQHQRVAIEAEEQGVSINQLLISKIS